jgi:hypothetical protein
MTWPRFSRRSDCAVEHAGQHALEITPRLPLLDRRRQVGDRGPAPRLVQAPPRVDCRSHARRRRRCRERYRLTDLSKAKLSGRPPAPWVRGQPEACRSSAKERQSSHLWQELWSFGALVAAAQVTGDKVSFVALSKSRSTPIF